jgi:hypothetical protein
MNYKYLITVIYQLLKFIEINLLLVESTLVLIYNSCGNTFKKIFNRTRVNKDT